MGEAASAMRERLFTIRMSEEETARLDRIAQKYGINQAAVVRMLIKREDDAIGAAPPGVTDTGAITASIFPPNVRGGINLRKVTRVTNPRKVTRVTKRR